ncbi:hypothetical protein PISMIDRAFT_160270 [Pisolithus microcarpus 441]|uniref:Uncharacterized protein n=1 Tax=Pisolithus microcarpus 441 TaxID=765257 RepID=A0A0C9YYN9_9AGAM|nr:hypothetical protein PISMIDRAFT_160270 [Pisolithus microcarpus 441]
MSSVNFQMRHFDSETPRHVIITYTTHESGEDRARGRYTTRVQGHGSGRDADGREGTSTSFGNWTPSNTRVSEGVRRLKMLSGFGN